MCLQERELSPLSSNEIPNHTSNNDMPNHHNYNKVSTTSICNQKPYIPGEFFQYTKFKLYYVRCLIIINIVANCFQLNHLVKRPDQAYNQRPTLGNTQKSNHHNRQGYHYQPVASTSRQSPTFILDDAIPGPSSRSLDYSSA